MAKKSNSRDTPLKLEFERKLWATVDALRNNMDAAEYSTWCSASYYENTSPIPA